jgi:hypothetical protein
VSFGIISQDESMDPENKTIVETYMEQHFGNEYISNMLVGLLLTSIGTCVEKNHTSYLAWGGFHVSMGIFFRYSILYPQFGICLGSRWNPSFSYKYVGYRIYDFHGDKSFVIFFL